MNINRFLSRREKDGSSHKRDKSRDKSAGDKKEKEKEKEKVMCWDSRSIIRPSLIPTKKSPFYYSLSSISAAFSNPHGKSSPLRQTSYSIIHTTSTDSRPGFFLQTRPNSSDGIFTLFKADPQKKVDRELSNKVRLPRLATWRLC
jgi:hypothetical protein